MIIFPWKRKRKRFCESPDSGTTIDLYTGHGLSIMLKILFFSKYRLFDSKTNHVIALPALNDDQLIVFG